MKILIVGAGIAGPTLAYWLAHYGMEPVLVEKLPHLRTGGYLIDFWGLGFDIADRMGLLREIRRKGYMMREVRIVNVAGQRIAGFPVESVSRLTQGRYISLARGDLAATIYDKIAGTTETIFNDTITRIGQSGDSIRVARCLSRVETCMSSGQHNHCRMVLKISSSTSPERYAMAYRRKRPDRGSHRLHSRRDDAGRRSARSRQLLRE